MKYSLIVLSGVLFLSGCASISSVEEVRAIAINAQKEAYRASEASTQAYINCEKTSDKLNRMFTKSMTK